jgi:hypothetical protein
LEFSGLQTRKLSCVSCSKKSIDVLGHNQENPKLNASPVSLLGWCQAQLSLSKEGQSISKGLTSQVAHLAHGKCVFLKKIPHFVF